MRDSRRGAEITMQSMLDVLGRWHRQLHVRTLLARWYNRKQEVYHVRVGSLLYPELLQQERAGHTVTGTGRKKVAKNTTRQINSKRGVEGNNMKTFTVDLSVMRGSERRWSSWVALKRSSLRWIDLRTKTTVTLSQKKKIDVYRGNWWIRSNFVGSDTMPIRHRPDFKESVVDIASPQESGGQSLLPKLAKLFLLVVAMANFLVASLLWDITTTMDLTLIERGNLRQSVNRLFICGMSLTKNLVQNYSDHFGNSQRSSLSPTVIVKSTSPVTENHYKNGYENCIYSMNNINMSDEDNNHDTNYINKHKYANHDTRKLQLWARHVERAVSVCLDVVSYTLHWLKFFESSLHPIFMHVWFSLISPSSLPTSTWLSPSSSTPLSWCTRSCTPTSTKGSLDTYDVTVSLTGCAFNLHSIFNNGLIPGGQDLSRRQTVFFLPIDPRDKNHKDPEYIDFSVPRRARYVHSAWKRHQDAVFWVDINLAIKEGLTFYQTRSNAIILQGTLPALCISKVERLKTGEVLHERPYLFPRPPPKISLGHDHDWTKGNDQLGSTVEQQPVGKLVQQSFGEAPRVTLSKPTQSKPKPICDRSGKP